MSIKYLSANLACRIRVLLVSAALGFGMPAHAAGDPAMAGEILVRLTNADALGPLLTSLGLSKVDQFGTRPIFRLRVIGAADVRDVIKALRKEPTVLDAEPNFVHQSPEARRNFVWTIGNATDYVSQWAPGAIHLAQAQGLSTGAGVRVAVLDTGVDFTHPALTGRLISGFDFVDFDTNPSEVGTTFNAGFGHGTHVAGIIALSAPGAKIMPLRVLDPEGRGDAWVIGQAIIYALDPDGNPLTDDGAHVINLSLGSVSRTHLMDTIARLASCTFLVPPVRAAEFTDPGYNADKQRCAGNRGAIIVASAGNGSSASEREYPAAEGAYGLLPVAASKSNATLAGFSNYGSWVQLAAPGDGITSSLPGGGFGTWSGTSMAAPFASATAALVWSVRPELSARDLVRHLEVFSSALCGAKQRQIDAAAAVSATLPADPVCPI